MYREQARLSGVRKEIPGALRLRIAKPAAKADRWKLQLGPTRVLAARWQALEWRAGNKSGVASGADRTQEFRAA